MKTMLCKPCWDSMKAWEEYLAKLGDDWEVYSEGADWKVLISSDGEDPILCEMFAEKIEQLVCFDQGWVKVKRDARVGPDAMRALLDAYEE